jgi:hypothetical protein
MLVRLTRKVFFQTWFLTVDHILLIWLRRQRFLISKKGKAVGHLQGRPLSLVAALFFRRAVKIIHPHPHLMLVNRTGHATLPPR